MTEEDIAAVIEAFGAAAARAKQAGFEVLEIYGAHGFLLHQFLTPLGNTRTDEYGGSAENRMRLPLAVVDSVALSGRSRARCSIACLPSIGPRAG